MNLNKRNYPPEHGIRLPFEVLKGFIVELYQKTDMPQEHATLLAEILTGNSQRCLYSHGIRMVPYYLEKIKAGAVNPNPRVSIISEAPASLVLDGDGGLGYFPCYEGTLKIIEKAKSVGIAALTSRNHQHFGSASNYTRLAVAHDCIGLSTSAHGNFLTPDNMVYDIVNTSPLSIAIPAATQPPLVLDMGGYFMRFDEDLFQQLPTPFFKVMALSSAIRSLGAVFAGVYKEEYNPPQSPWECGQGAFIVAIAVDHFMPADELKQEMDRFVGAARQAKPLPGMERAELAGGNEWEWDRQNKATGIPINEADQLLLQQTADEWGVESPFARFEDTRF